MMANAAVSNRLYILWMIALFAASLIGVSYDQAISTGSTFVAECFNGQTLDSSTGVCPVVTGVPAPTNPSNGWGPAVKEAEAANQIEGTLAD